MRLRFEEMDILELAVHVLNICFNSRRQLAVVAAVHREVEIGAM